MIERGSVVQLGKHRLMCGDAGNPYDVSALFAGAKPDLVFTSPPYAQQRHYVSGIGDWDTLMQRVFAAMPWHERTQVLVNLGLVHRKGEWVEYWRDWIAWMRMQEWQRRGWYVWDKLAGLPTLPRDGRLYPCHEFLFHFSKQPRIANRTVPCVSAGKTSSTGGLRRNNNVAYVRPSHRTNTVNPTRIADSVIRVSSRGSGGHGHCAPFPIGLPTELIRAYTDAGELVYDPFAGSGTSILAAENEGRTCYAMEIEPTYVQIAIKRYNKHIGVAA